MLTQKMAVNGPIARVEPDQIIIRRGDVVESYNTNYYRVLPEVESGSIQRIIEPERTASERRD